MALQISTNSPYSLLYKATNEFDASKQCNEKISEGTGLA